MARKEGIRKEDRGEVERRIKLYIYLDLSLYIFL